MSGEVPPDKPEQLLTPERVIERDGVLGELLGRIRERLVRMLKELSPEDEKRALRDLRIQIEMPGHPSQTLELTSNFNMGEFCRYAEETGRNRLLNPIYFVLEDVFGMNVENIPYPKILPLLKGFMRYKRIGRKAKTLLFDFLVYKGMIDERERAILEEGGTLQREVYSDSD